MTLGDPTSRNACYYWIFLLFHCKVMTLGDPTSSAVDREYGQLSDGSIDPKVSSWPMWPEHSG